jgi:lipopolysaccharide biosynthesis regulator YciM
MKERLVKSFPMSVRIDQLPEQEFSRRLGHHIQYLGIVMTETIEIDPDYYLLLMEDLEGIESTHDHIVKNLQTDPSMRTLEELLEVKRAEALEFYELVYDQVDRIHEYLVLIERLRNELALQSLKYLGF